MSGKIACGEMTQGKGNIVTVIKLYKIYYMVIIQLLTKHSEGYYLFDIIILR